jgi:hypothetical protein
MKLAETWHCRAPASRIDQAMSLGAELGGELALILVLSDHPPPKGVVPEKGRLQWWSFGKARTNLAIVNAARTNREGADRCLIEVANLSEEAQRTTLTVEPLDGGTALRKTTLELGPGATQRMVMQFPDGTPAVRARIDDDDLPIDNAVVLQPMPAHLVRVEVRILDRRVRDPLEKAIRSARNAELGAAVPELVFTDRISTGHVPEERWQVQFIAEKEASAYSGPFVLDRAHPLTEGLSLKTAVWGAGKEKTLDGAPLIMAGNVPLIGDVESPIPGGGARHDLHIRFRPDLSTVQNSPDWPILIWNILNWRASALPGLSRQNVRLGEQVVLTLPGYRENVEVRPPGESARMVSVKGRQLALRADEIGVWEIRSGRMIHRFAVNALRQDASDLRQCITGQWGDWLDETSLRLEFSPIAWVLLLLLLGIGCVHLLMMARPGMGPGLEPAKAGTPAKAG